MDKCVVSHVSMQNSVNPAEGFRVSSDPLPYGQTNIYYFHCGTKLTDTLMFCRLSRIVPYTFRLFSKENSCPSDALTNRGFPAANPVRYRLLLRSLRAVLGASLSAVRNACCI